MLQSIRHWIALLFRQSTYIVICTGIKLAGDHVKESWGSMLTMLPDLDPEILKHRLDFHLLRQGAVTVTWMSIGECCTQEEMWKQWFQQADALVMLPDAEGIPSVVWTEQERRISYKACLTERRIHSNPVMRQHMFTVGLFLLVEPLCFTSHTLLLYKLCSSSARPTMHA